MLDYVPAQFRVRLIRRPRYGCRACKTAPPTVNPLPQRRTIRLERSRPLVEAMQAWLNETLDRISGRSALAQAIRYARNHWSIGLVSG